MQGLKFITDLSVSPGRQEDGFQYTHHPTGFRFEICEEDKYLDDDFEGGLVFKPLCLGNTEQVTDLRIIVSLENLTFIIAFLRKHL